jgi:SAM-dependent methyltransferase
LFPNADYKRADFGDLADLDYVIGMDSRVEEKDETFDLILSTQVAEHALAPIMYFKECFRLLRPGGWLICTTHGTYPDHGCPFDFQRWTADGLARDLTAIGFELDRMQKLTTNVRALMYLTQKFSGWVESPSTATDSVFRVFRSAMHRSPKMWQKMSDKAFPNNRIVEARDEGHELYLGLVAVGQRPDELTIKGSNPN